MVEVVKALAGIAALVVFAKLQLATLLRGRLVGCCWAGALTPRPLDLGVQEDGSLIRHDVVWSLVKMKHPGSRTRGSKNWCLVHLKFTLNRGPFQLKAAASQFCTPKTTSQRGTPGALLHQL